MPKRPFTHTCSDYEKCGSGVDLLLCVAVAAPVRSIHSCPCSVCVCVCVCFVCEWLPLQRLCVCVCFLMCVCVCMPRPHERACVLAVHGERLVRARARARARGSVRVVQGYLPLLATLSPSLSLHTHERFLQVSPPPSLHTHTERARTDFLEALGERDGLRGGDLGHHRWQVEGFLLAATIRL